MYIYIYIYNYFILLFFSKVKLATQVLSKSIMISLQESGNEEVLGTANFCGMMNDVRSRTEHIRRKNHFIKPYTSTDDERFSWLLDVFVKYLNDWKENTLNRPGNFSPAARQKMFLSQQTYEGLKISAYSHVEAIQFLLGKSFQYVLSERFMQDVLEDYFEHQRSKGGRSDNPTAQQFGYNDLTIAAQRDILHQSLDGTLVEGMKKRNGSKLARNLLRSEQNLCNHQRKNKLISGGKIVTINRGLLYFIKVDNCFSTLL